LCRQNKDIIDFNLKSKAKFDARFNFKLSILLAQYIKSLQLKKQSRESLHPIKSIEEIHKGVFVLSIERRFDFIPGEIIALSLSKEEKAPRLYSICSSNEDSELKILFNVVPSGMITEALSKLKKGDNVYCSSPYGRFHIGDEPSVWIANGTGIAPFVSKILSGEVKDQILIHGAREKDSFYFSKELQACKGLEYIRCSSIEKGEEFFHGRLTKYLSELKELPADRLYYLCGGTEMVVEARDILISGGVPYNKILSEIYF